MLEKDKDFLLQEEIDRINIEAHKTIYAYLQSFYEFQNTSKISFWQELRKRVKNAWRVLFFGDEIKNDDDYD